MNITWFGQSCFRIESKEGSIVVDPFSKEIGLKPPKLKDNIVLVSHNHYDHNNTEGINEDAFLINGPGEYEKQGISVRGVLSYHDQKNGQERGLNTMYVIKAEGMTICHLGDLGQTELSDQQLDDIGDVDVLMVPVGGKYTLDHKEAVHVIGQVEPKIVIPMHYKIKDLQSEIEGVEKFVKELGIQPEKTDKLKIAAKTLPVEETKLVIFEI